MDELFKQVNAHLQELESSQKMTVVELDQVKNDLAKLTGSVDMVRNSVTLAHAATTALMGTFASIEQMFKDIKADIEDLKALKPRVEALERRQPPAA